MPGNLGIAAAKPAVARILAAVRAITQEIGGRELSVTASAGLTEFSFGAASLNEAMRAADKALYKAKQAGRDRAEVEVLGRAA